MVVLDKIFGNAQCTVSILFKSFEKKSPRIFKSVWLKHHNAGERLRHDFHITPFTAVATLSAIAKESSGYMGRDNTSFASLSVTPIDRAVRIRPL